MSLELSQMLSPPQQLVVMPTFLFAEFPPFQKQILENNLINVAATIAFNDYESYVQVSALKCIGAASRINVVWEQLIVEYPDIQVCGTGFLKRMMSNVRYILKVF